MYTVPQYSASIGVALVRVVALYRAHAQLTGTTSVCEVLGLQTVSHGDSPTLWPLSSGVIPPLVLAASNSPKQFLALH